LVAVAEAQFDAGDTNWRSTLHWAIDEARRSADPAILASVATGVSLGWPSVAGHVDNPRVAGIVDALERAGGPARARLLAVLAVELCFVAPLCERRAMSDEALDLARRSGNTALLLFVQSQRFSAIWAPETLLDRNAAADEALALSDHLGARFVRAIVAGFRAAGAVEQGDLAACDRCRAVVRDLAPTLASPVLDWGLPLHASWRAVIDGDLEHAEQLCYEALAVADRTSRPDGELVFFNQLMGIRWVQDRLVELRARLEDAAESIPSLPALRAWLAKAALDDGDLDAAARILEDDARSEFAGWEGTCLTLSALLVAAEVAAGLGHRGAAARIFVRLTPYAAQFAFTGTTFYGPASYGAGLAAAAAGDVRHGAVLLEEAARSAARFGAPLFVERARRARSAFGLG
jgi:hypothetical protein